MLLSKVTYNGFVQHISNELKTLHIQSELSSHVEAVCVCVCWHWPVLMVNTKKNQAF